MWDENVERTRTVYFSEGLHFGGYHALIVSRVKAGFVGPVVDFAEFMMGFVASMAGFVESLEEVVEFMME